MVHRESDVCSVDDVCFVSEGCVIIQNILISMQQSGTFYDGVQEEEHCFYIV